MTQCLSSPVRPTAGGAVPLPEWVLALHDVTGDASWPEPVTLDTAGGQRLSLARMAADEGPAFASGAACRVLFDGRLYNRAALRAELTSPFMADPSDARLALEAYLRWGQDALHRLEGVFVVCIWDRRTRTLLCARDPLGVYPLFYARAGRGLLLATSIGALLRHPQVPGTLDRTALAAYLLRAYRDIEETCFAGIRRVPAGHVLRARLGEDTRVSRYWTPFPSGAISWTRDDDLEQFPVLMRQAIGRCLQVGAGGVYLSGGLDSGTVATLAADHCASHGLRPLHAISMIYADADANEERTQTGIARNLRLPHTLVPFDDAASPAGLFAGSLRSNCTWPHPFAVGLSPLHLMLGARARHAGCAVVLSGEGGDEWLGIHYELAADFISRGRITDLLRLCAVKQRNAAAPWWAAARRVVIQAGIHPLVQRARRQAWRRMAPQLARERRRRWVERTLPAWLAPDPDLRARICERADRAADRFDRTFYRQEVMDGILDHPLTLLYKEDGFESSRRTGVLMLEPFYDPAVVRFLVRTPPWLRSRGGRLKGLLRRTLHARHPGLGYDTQRKPYGTRAIGERVLRDASRTWRDLRGARSLGQLGVVDEQRMNHAMGDMLASGDVSHTQAVWMALCAETWSRSRVESPAQVVGVLTDEGR